MNILLWILQVLLALHTLMGAVWKFANSEQKVTSLSAIPHELWLVLGVVEIIFSVALVLPAFVKNDRLGRFVPMAAAGIAAEMLLFTGVHLSSGETNHSPVAYWMVVAAVSAFVSFGRTKLKPL